MYRVDCRYKQKIWVDSSLFNSSSILFIKQTFILTFKSVERDNKNKKSIVQEPPLATLAHHAKTVRDWFLLKLWDVTDMQITGKRTLIKNSISGLFKF